jgi:hypothetical protein
LVQPITLLALEQYIIALKRRVQKKHCELRARAFGFIDEKKRIKRDERMGKEGFNDNDDNNH